MKECIERNAAIEAMDEDMKNYRGFMAEEQFTHEDAKEVLAKIPTADVVEVVRCKDCKNRFNIDVCKCRGDDWFCGYGERKTK